ncbi:EAL and HDOD domain-containing protein [Tepidibacter hydrothermalis]|uniref:EAL domain-containing protein n=1 Tax=Tepidibacter hydrothermalis TaxID=3036126 RepID=A0ABY8EEW3_9FIRM|nr:EAL domain-containing protein [Tepidibacter hydrothermalis]WFD10319.1 EAL domain-containing protein [Tepidibacter hydrothermalis]
MDIYIARQPIFDNKYNVIAYELLYRDGDGNFFNGNVSDNVATSILLVNSYFNFGINNLVGESKVFINFDSHLIKSDIAELLNKDKVVIEILETVEPDKKLLRKIKRLNELGYTLAIDDYTTDYKYNEITKSCDIVKVDFMENTKGGIESLVKQLKKSGKLILAEKVETKEEFEWAKSIGFDYYQGFYFSRPSLQKGKALSESALQYVRVMNELNTPEPSFRILSDIIGLDLSLTYKLLKLVNSNGRLLNEITSIQQAIAILGVNELTRWLSLAMVQDMCKQETSEAVKCAMIRSNLLKEIAIHSDLKEYVEELSLLGTLSIVDTVLETNMDEALKPIPISKEMKKTLLGQQTIYSDAMALCFAYERGVFDDIRKSASNINYNIKLLSSHYLASVKWADKMFEELKNDFY